MGNKGPECKCHLMPTIARLFPSMEGMIRRATTSYPWDDPMRWNTHMAVEELLIFPLLPAEVRVALEADHAQMVSMMNTGMQVPADLLVRHAELEAAAFSKI